MKALTRELLFQALDYAAAAVIGMGLVAIIAALGYLMGVGV